MEVVVTILAGALSLIASAAFGETLLRSRTLRYLLTALGIPVPERSRFREETSYSERLSELTVSLTDASMAVDRILAELTEVAAQRTEAVALLERDLEAKSALEVELKQRIEVLQNTPVEAADYFAQLMTSGERRSARRDYMLFGAGVIVTTIIAVAIQLLAS